MPRRVSTCLWLLAASVIASAQPPASRPAPDDLSDFLETLRTDHDLPAVAAIVFRTDSILAQGAAGVRARGSEPQVTLDDRFHLGSCTKAMTAALIAKLVETGRLKWDDTIESTFADLRGRILPEYLPVTLEQLLTHRSGLPEDRAGGPLLLTLRSLSGSPAEQRREALPHILSLIPAAAPGEKMVYSNSGYVVAAAMAEHATKRNWEDLMGEFVFESLGITTGGFGPPGTDAAIDQPRGHRESRGSIKPMPPESPFSDNPVALFPGGAAHMSLPDWVRFGQDHLAAGRAGRGMLRADSYHRLHTPPGESGYAMGWGVGSSPRLGRTLSHAGSNTMWFALIRLAPERDLGIVIAANLATRDVMEALPRAADDLLFRYVRPTASRPAGSQPASSQPAP